MSTEEAAGPHDRYDHLLATLTDPQLRQIIQDIGRERVEALESNTTLEMAHLPCQLDAERQNYETELQLLTQRSVDNDTEVGRLQQEFLSRMQGLDDRYTRLLEWADEQVREAGIRERAAIAQSDQESSALQLQLSEAGAIRKHVSKGQARVKKEMAELKKLVTTHVCHNDVLPPFFQLINLYSAPRTRSVLPIKLRAQTNPV